MPGNSARLRWFATVISLGLAAYLLFRAGQALYISFGGGTAVDYLAVASAGRLVSAGNHCLYCPGDLAAAQSALLGYTPAVSATFPVSFVNPPLAAWLSQPLAGLPLQAGADIFTNLNLAAMAAALLLLVAFVRPQLGLLLGVGVITTLVFSVPANTGILLGQSDGLMLLCAAGSVVALDKGRRWLAGVLLIPLLLKPQLVWLVVPALIISEQWRVLLVVVAGIAVVVGTTFLLVGADHAFDVIAVLTSRGYEHLDLQSNSIPALIARPLASNIAAWVVGLAGAGVAVVAMILHRSQLRSRPVVAVAAGLALSVALTPHLGDYSLMLLAVPVAVLARNTAQPHHVPILAVTLTFLFTASTLINPLAALGLSPVAAVLLLGLLAVLGRIDLASGRGATVTARTAAA
jgi:hypothetical protein